MISKDRNRLSLGERLGEFIGMFGVVALFAFFLYHQWAATGFFTAKFGGLEQLCLYLPLVFSFFPPMIRAISGRRNPARPWEITANVLLVLGALRLLSVFPFDYTHLADALPRGLRFMLSWVTDDIARFVFVIQITIGIISVFAILWRYVTFRPQEQIA